MLEKNTNLSTLVEMLDAKTSITIWSQDEELFFKGTVYQLYDNDEIHKYFVTYLRFGMLEGVTAQIEKISFYNSFE